MQNRHISIKNKLPTETLMKHYAIKTMLSFFTKTTPSNSFISTQKMNYYQ